MRSRLVRGGLLSALLGIGGLAGAAPAALAIVGGQPAQDYPAIAYVVSPNPSGTTELCTGTLVTPVKVLTAAHCVVDQDLDQDVGETVPPKQPFSGYQVTLGAQDLTASGLDRYSVTDVKVAPGYEILTKENDAAVLTLARPATETPMRVIYGGETELVKPGTLATTAGYGDTVQDGNGSDILLEVQLPIRDQDSCGTSGFDEDLSVCAGGGPGGKGTCQGDSGGPLMAPDYAGRPTLIGVVSNAAPPCGGPEAFGFFTRLQRSKVGAWLDKQIGSHTSDGTADPDGDDDIPLGGGKRARAPRVERAGDVVPDRKGRVAFKFANPSSVALTGRATLRADGQRLGRIKLSLAAKRYTVVRIPLSVRALRRLNRAREFNASLRARVQKTGGQPTKLSKHVILRARD